MTKLVSIVTGASRGLGKSIAKYLSTIKQHRVVITASSQLDLEQTQKEIEQLGGECKLIRADLSSSNAAKEIVDFTIKNYGKIDRVVANAGVLGPIKPLAELQTDELQKELQRVFQINVFSIFELVNVALPELRKTKGRIICISSGAAHKAIHGWSLYCTSKAALNHFCFCLAEEEKENEVGIISLSPGVIDTDMQKYIRESGSKETMKDYEKFVNYYETSSLQDPEYVGKVVSGVCDYFPLELSGKFKSIAENDILQLMK
ncbi:hypothetical protein ABK040_008278 [Willaertia magna]